MTTAQTIDYLILGAGPAGLQTAELLARRGDDYLVLERAAQPGAFFATFPRHRTLLSINKLHTGYSDLESRRRYDWNSLLNDDEELQFTRYSEDYLPHADDFVRYLGDFAERRGLQVRYGCTVCSVEREGGCFVVSTAAGERYAARRLLVATGLFLPCLPSIPGIELCESYNDFDLDPEGFRDQRVLILGKGNSAFETAEALIPVTRKIQVAGPHHVRLAWVSHFVGDVRAVNNNFLDTYHLKGQNNVLDGELVEVSRRDDGFLEARLWFESRQCHLSYVCDRVIACTGFRFDDSIFGDTCRPDLAFEGRLPAMTCEWESTNIPDLYFLGTLMQTRDRKKTMSSFIHGFRHNQVALDGMFERKYRRGAWPGVTEVRRDEEAIAEALIERVSTSAGMFLQPGFLGDLLTFPDDLAKPIRLFPDMPVDYIHEHEAPGLDRFYVMTLEYGHVDGYRDPFAMPRGIGVSEDFYLHPVLRRFEAGEQSGKLVLPDDLDNDWRLDPENWRRLEGYFALELAPAAPPARAVVTDSRIVGE